MKTYTAAYVLDISVLGFGVITGMIDRRGKYERRTDNK